MYVIRVLNNTLGYLFSYHAWGLFLLPLTMIFSALAFAYGTPSQPAIGYYYLLIGISGAASMYLIAGAWWRAMLMQAGTLALVLLIANGLASADLYIAPTVEVAEVMNDIMRSVFGGGLIICVLVSSFRLIQWGITEVVLRLFPERPKEQLEPAS